VLYTPVAPAKFVRIVTCVNTRNKYKLRRETNYGLETPSGAGDDTISAAPVVALPSSSLELVVAAASSANNLVTAKSTVVPISKSEVRRLAGCRVAMAATS
jgi:hypothetical protein